MRIRTAVATTAVAAIAVLGTAGVAAADGDPGDGTGTAGMPSGMPAGTGNPPAMGSDKVTANYPPSLFDLVPSLNKQLMPPDPGRKRPRQPARKG
ncbi:hypothetical protein [Streptomyces sp. CT34]|uniref:hypothetical protein n=1 Tax=Streptomyces sp. CT34 TaxID=1553907 RepID=UPI0005B8DF2D|nr:hypothetical protein [Streptomyces sp. CT34]